MLTNNELKLNLISLTQCSLNFQMIFQNCLKPRTRKDCVTCFINDRKMYVLFVKPRIILLCIFMQSMFFFPFIMFMEWNEIFSNYLLIALYNIFRLKSQCNFFSKIFLLKTLEFIRYANYTTYDTLCIITFQNQK